MNTSEALSLSKLVGNKGLSNIDKAIARYKIGVEKLYPEGDIVELRLNKYRDASDDVGINIVHHAENGKEFAAELSARSAYIARDDYFCTFDYEIGGVENGQDYFEGVLLATVPDEYPVNKFEHLLFKMRNIKTKK